MPRIVSDSVDVYTFRRVNGRVRFLVLLRRPEIALGNTWHGIHGKVRHGETASQAALREVRETLGILPSSLYSADLIGQFYDHFSDSITLAPVFAAEMTGPGPVILSPDYVDFKWCDLEEAVTLLFSHAQRHALRHIYSTIAMAGADADLYLIE